MMDPVSTPKLMWLVFVIDLHAYICMQWMATLPWFLICLTVPPSTAHPKARVTRLDEFSPNRRLFNSSSFFIISEVAQNWFTVSEVTYIFSHIILTKLDWSAFRPSFSQTHLVTLPEAHFA
jgi:hypothetical protein